jgi:hypothetical protein
VPELKGRRDNQRHRMENGGHQDADDKSFHG